MPSKIKIQFKHKEKGTVVDAYVDSSGDSVQDEKIMQELVKIWELDGKWEHVKSN